MEAQTQSNARVIPDVGKDEPFKTASQWEAARDEYLETVYSLRQALAADDDGMPVPPEDVQERTVYGQFRLLAAS